MKVDEITGSEDKISELALVDGRVALLPAGSVLVVTRSGILSHTLPVAVTKLPVTINQDLKALNPKPAVSPKYVAHALRGASQTILKRCSKHGTTVASVDTKALLDFEIPMVGIDEQHKIVAEIEKQFSRLDEAVANLQRVKANLKRYKASVLKAAIEGRLVESEASIARREGRSFENGVRLLERLLEERRNNWQGRFRTPVSYDTDALNAVPQGWTWASLDSVSWHSSYGSSAKCTYDNGGIPILRIPNVQNGAIDLHDLKFAPTDVTVESGEAVDRGDMLVIRTNGSKSLIGRAAVALTAPHMRVGFASYLIRFRLTDPTNLPAWLSVVWPEGRLRSWMERRAATSAGQHNISQSVLATAAIPLPPFAEQRRIVGEVDRRFSIVREVEAEVDANLKRAQTLRQSTLQRTFSSNGLSTLSSKMKS